MNSHDVLSSEQALDDYFVALLGEEVETFDVDKSLISKSPSVEQEPELALQLTQVEALPFRESCTPELEVPNLADVERLLSQLETKNVVDELGIDDILAQNTIDLASQSEPVVEAISTPLAEAEEVPGREIDPPDVETSLPVFYPVQTETEEVTQAEPQVVTEPKTLAGSDMPTTWQSTQRAGDFQVLYFDVNQVLFAVPLDELGGIHRISELNQLIGKPAWYLGLQTNREQKFDVVDTAKWVMADKLRSEEYKENYQYVVMLGQSSWGLASNQLMGTETLNGDEVCWREKVGKRPWLAGIVKEKMCALIHVKALVEMLNAGLDVKQ